MKAHPTRNPQSAPALSLDRLHINYKRDGGVSFVLISPEDKLRFLRELASGGAGLEVHGCRPHITFFAIFPPSLKYRNLKVAIVFNYEAFRFEAWLAGRNRQVQRQHWKLFKDSKWPAYRVSTPAKGVDSIVECDLAKDFDFSDPDALTSSIETATCAFIDDMENFLSERQHPR